MQARGWTPSSVEAFLSLEYGRDGAAANYATWEAAVLGFSSVAELRAIRKRARERTPAAKPLGPRLRRLRGAFAFDKRLGAWVTPFMGSDASIVRRTQDSLAASDPSFSPVHHSVSITIRNRLNLVRLGVAGAVFTTLVKYSWGRQLLLRFPGLFSCGVFSRGGPTPSQIEGTSFSMTFLGRGFSSAPSESALPDGVVVTRISGPEPGYAACSIIMAQAALVVLEEAARLPPGGGVFTSAELLRHTSFLDRVQKHGIQLDVLE
mmetsp:Transcript_4297/g.12008  ORF Transcript_4297/g.12008 Transcript_4297/m.12008 type:complete len:263 (+) Transcript_4297:309-1097(+)